MRRLQGLRCNLESSGVPNCLAANRCGSMQFCSVKVGTTPTEERDASMRRTADRVPYGFDGRQGALCTRSVGEGGDLGETACAPAARTKSQSLKSGFGRV